MPVYTGHHRPSGNEQTLCSALIDKMGWKNCRLSKCCSGSQSDSKKKLKSENTLNCHRDNYKSHRHETNGQDAKGDLEAIIKKIKRITALLPASLALSEAYEKGLNNCKTCMTDKEEYKQLMQNIKVVEILIDGVIEKEQGELLNKGNKSDDTEQEKINRKSLSSKEIRKLTFSFEIFSGEDVIKHNLKCILIRLQKTIGDTLVQVAFVKTRGISNEKRYNIFDISLDDIKLLKFQFTNLTDKIIQLEIMKKVPDDKSDNDICIACIKEKLTKYNIRLTEIIKIGRNLKVVMRNQQPEAMNQCCSRPYPHVHAQVHGKPLVLKYSLPFEVQEFLSQDPMTRQGSLAMGSDSSAYQHKPYEVQELSSQDPMMRRAMGSDSSAYQRKSYEGEPFKQKALPMRRGSLRGSGSFQREPFKIQERISEESLTRRGSLAMDPDAYKSEPFEIEDPMTQKEFLVMKPDSSKNKPYKVEESSSGEPLTQKESLAMGPDSSKYKPLKGEEPLSKGQKKRGSLEKEPDSVKYKPFDDTTSSSSEYLSEKESSDWSENKPLKGQETLSNKGPQTKRGSLEKESDPSKYKPLKGEEPLSKGPQTKRGSLEKESDSSQYKPLKGEEPLSKGPHMKRGSLEKEPDTYKNNPFEESSSESMMKKKYLEKKPDSSKNKPFEESSSESMMKKKYLENNPDSSKNKPLRGEEPLSKGHQMNRGSLEKEPDSSKYKPFEESSSESMMKKKYLEKEPDLSKNKPLKGEDPLSKGPQTKRGSLEKEPDSSKYKPFEESSSESMMNKKYLENNPDSSKNKPLKGEDPLSKEPQTKRGSLEKEPDSSKYKPFEESSSESMMRKKYLENNPDSSKNKPIKGEDPLSKGPQTKRGSLEKEPDSSKYKPFEESSSESMMRKKYLENNPDSSKNKPLKGEDPLSKGPQTKRGSLEKEPDSSKNKPFEESSSESMMKKKYLENNPDSSKNKPFEKSSSESMMNKRYLEKEPDSSKNKEVARRSVVSEDAPSIIDEGKGTKGERDKLRHNKGVTHEDTDQPRYSTESSKLKNNVDETVQDKSEPISEKPLQSKRKGSLDQSSMDDSENLNQLKPKNQNNLQLGKEIQDDDVSDDSDEFDFDLKNIRTKPRSITEMELMERRSTTPDIQFKKVSFYEKGSEPVVAVAKNSSKSPFIQDPSSPKITLPENYSTSKTPFGNKLENVSTYPATVDSIILTKFRKSSAKSSEVEDFHIDKAMSAFKSFVSLDNEVHDSVKSKPKDISHQNKKIEHLLKKLGKEKLLTLTTPADCCEVNNFLAGCRSSSNLPLSASLYSLPLDHSDLRYIARVAGINLSREELWQDPHQDVSVKEYKWETQAKPDSETGQTKWQRAMAGTETRSDYSIRSREGSPIKWTRVKNTSSKEDLNLLPTIDEEEPLVEKKNSCLPYVPSIPSLPLSEDEKNCLSRKKHLNGKNYKTMELRYFTVEFEDKNLKEKLLDCTHTTFVNNRENKLQSKIDIIISENGLKLENKKQPSVESFHSCCSSNNILHSDKQKSILNTPDSKLSAIDEMIMMNAVYLCTTEKKDNIAWITPINNHTTSSKKTNSQKLKNNYSYTNTKTNEKEVYGIRACFDSAKENSTLKKDIVNKKDKSKSPVKIEHCIKALYNTHKKTENELFYKRNVTKCPNVDSDSPNCVGDKLNNKNNRNKSPESQNKDRSFYHGKNCCAITKMNNKNPLSTIDKLQLQKNGNNMTSTNLINKSQLQKPLVPTAFSRVNKFPNDTEIIKQKGYMSKHTVKKMSKTEFVNQQKTQKNGIIKLKGPIIKKHKELKRKPFIPVKSCLTYKRMEGKTKLPILNFTKLKPVLAQERILTLEYKTQNTLANMHANVKNKLSDTVIEYKLQYMNKENVGPPTISFGLEKEYISVKRDLIKKGEVLFKTKQNTLLNLNLIKKSVSNQNMYLRPSEDFYHPIKLVNKKSYVCEQKKLSVNTQSNIFNNERQQTVNESPSDKIIMSKLSEFNEKTGKSYLMDENLNPFYLYDVDGLPLTDNSGRPLRRINGDLLMNCNDVGIPISDDKNRPICDALGHNFNSEKFISKKLSCSEILQTLTTSTGEPMLLYDVEGRPLTSISGTILVDSFGKSLIKFGSTGKPVSDMKGRHILDSSGIAQTE